MVAEIMRDAGLWVREFDLQRSMNRVEFSLDYPAVDCTTFGSGGRTFAIDVPRAPFTAAGYPINDAADTALFDLAGETDLTLTAAVEREIGAVAFTGSILDTRYSSNFAIGAVRGFEMAGEMSRRSFGRGSILHLGSAVAATGAGDDQELKAIGASFMAFATLHVTAVTGTPTFTGRVESDSDTAFTTPTTRATFAGIIGPALGSELIQISGPVTDTFWRFAWIIAGTGTVTFAAAIGFEE
jgi:hypothetical protein